MQLGCVFLADLVAPLGNPNWHLIPLNGCSTLARVLALALLDTHASPFFDQLGFCSADLSLPGRMAIDRFTLLALFVFVTFLNTGIASVTHNMGFLRHAAKLVHLGDICSVGWSTREAVNHPGVTSTPNVRLNAEIILLPLFGSDASRGLVYPSLFLSNGRMNDGCTTTVRGASINAVPPPDND